MAPPPPPPPTPGCLSTSTKSSSSSPSTPTTPSTNPPFSPSTTTTSSSSSSSSASSVQSPLSHYPRPRSSVPFSWEAQPGVPKHAPDKPHTSTATSSKLQPPPATTAPLRPPPSSTLRTNSDLLPTLRRRGSTRSPRTAGGPSATNLQDPVFVRDPFAAALAECCSETQNFLDGDDDLYHDASGACGRGGGDTRRWAAEYYCSPLVSNKTGAAASSRRWGAAQYYCSPPRVQGKSSRGGGSTAGSKHQLLASIFGLRSLQGLYVSCKTASAVADSIAYVPPRAASAGRFRSTGSTPGAASSFSSSSSSFSRSDSIGLNRRRRAR